MSGIGNGWRNIGGSIWLVIEGKGSRVDKMDR